MNSLAFRLTSSLMLAVLILAVLFYIGLSWSLHNLGVTFAAARLRHDLDNLISSVSIDTHYQLTIDPERVARFFFQPYSGHYFVIQTRGDTLRSRSLWDAKLTLEVDGERPLERAFFLTGPNNESLLALKRKIRRQGEIVSFLITESFAEIEAELQKIQMRVGLAGVSVLGLLMLGQYLIVRNGLRPLSRIRRQILALSSGEIRQLDAHAPLEVKPLVDELNRLLDIVTQRLERSRVALGNLAHGLKTPLAILIQNAEHRDTANHREILDQANQIQWRVNRALKQARIAGPAAPGQHARLKPIVNGLVATLQKIYREKTLHVEIQVSCLQTFSADRNDFTELLGNLLDNAFKWAHSTVELMCESTEDALIIRIGDDGPGCPTEQLDALTGRGNRFDESETGHGLGLAIVHDIVRQYKGRLTFQSGTRLTGLLVIVELPKGYTAFAG